MTPQTLTQTLIPTRRLKAFLMMPVIAGSWLLCLGAGAAFANPFAPQLSVDVIRQDGASGPAAAWSAPAIKITMTRDTSEQAIKDFTLVQPGRPSLSPLVGAWRANSSATPASCTAAQLSLNNCPADSEIGTATATARLLLVDIPIQGNVYMMYQDETDEQNNVQQPVKFAIHFPLLGPIALPDFFAETYLRTGDLRLQTDMLDLPSSVQGVLKKLELTLYAGGDPAHPRGGILRTPPRAACNGEQVFDASLTSYADSDPSTTLAYAMPSPALTSCDVQAPYAPTIEATSSTNAAGQSPVLTMTIHRQPGEAFTRDMTFHLPEGLVGSPFATAETCTADQAATDNCPADSKVGSAVAKAVEFASRPPITVSGNLYNGVVAGSELARILFVARSPAVADHQILVLPTTINPRPALSGLDATVTDMPTEIDIQDLQFTFDGTTGLDKGRPLLINPTACGTGQIAADFTSEMDQPYSAQVPYEVTGCDALPYDPKLDVKLSCTDTNCAPALESTITQAPGEATTKSVRFMIPQGFAINLQSSVRPCTPELADTNSCPETSQVGTAAAESPLTPDPLTGNLYLVNGANPGDTSVLRLHGVLHGLVDVTLDGIVKPTTQGLTTVIDNLPQVPVSKIVLSLAGGSRALITTPKATCGPAVFAAEMTSHSGKTANPTSTVNIGGKNCRPAFAAQLSPPTAGARTRLNLDVTPTKGTPPVRSFSVSLGSGKRRLKVGRATGKSRGNLGSLMLQTVDGTRRRARLVQSGRSLAVKAAAKDRVSEELAHTSIKLAKKKLTVTRLPDVGSTAIQVTLNSSRGKLLSNPRRCGRVSLKGRFSQADGSVTSLTAKPKVRCKKRHQKWRP